MCILFMFVSDNPTPDSYKVILAVNRDENYKRPTKLADYWGTKPDILGARDMEPGREGGTWLAMSKTGKIGALLNVMQTRANLLNSQNRRGRGFLVNNYLQSTSSDPMHYLTELHAESSEYSPFSLLTIDVCHQNGPQICYYSCTPGSQPQRLSTGKVYGIGNSYIDNPFLKIISGKEEFTAVLRENNSLGKTKNLIEGILDILKNPELNHPDPQILKQGPDHLETFVRGISSRFIKLPGYGTRTHTIILIDYHNNVTYKEITLSEPIDENDLRWTTSSFDFQIKPDDLIA